MDSHNYLNFGFHIAQGHIPHQIAHVCGAPCFLTAFRWSLPHYYKRNIIWTHKLHFMPLILQCFYNTFLPSPIQNSNQRWMWNSNLWHKMHLGPSLQLGYFPAKHGECFQISDVERGHISKTLCNKWGHHIIHPLCLWILCIWISPCFIITIIVTAMLQSSHFPWELMKVIPWEDHYSF